jgi:hypothetical protein
MSVESRMDDRTPSQFMGNIKTWTQVEGRMAELVVEDMKMRGVDCRGFKDTGVDNSGEFIDGSLKSNNADFDFVFEFGTVSMEVKVANPKEDTCQTFKLNDIRKAAERGGSILCYSEKWYYIMPAGTCRYLMENFPKRIYRYLSPNDKAIRINSAHLAKERNMAENERGPKLWEEFLEDGSIRKFHWKTVELRDAAAEAISEARRQKSLSGR